MSNGSSELSPELTTLAGQFAERNPTPEEIAVFENLSDDQKRQIAEIAMQKVEAGEPAELTDKERTYQETIGRTTFRPSYPFYSDGDADRRVDPGA